MICRNKGHKLTMINNYNNKYQNKYKDIFKRRDIKNKILSFIVLIALFSTMFPLTALGADDKDVTEYVDMGGWNLTVNQKVIVTDGALVQGAPAVQPKQNAVVYYNWSIDQDNMKYIEEGSYFVIDTKTLDFTFTLSGSVDITDQDGKVIAVMTSETDGDSTKFIITFTAYGAEKEYHADGWITALCFVNSFSDDTTSVSINGLDIPARPEPKSDFKWGNEPNTKLFTKGNLLSPNGQQITYVIHVNKENNKLLYEGKNGFNLLEDVRIEDYLPTGTKFLDGSLMIYSTFNLAKGDEVSSTAGAEIPLTMSDKRLTSYDDITNGFQIVKSDDPDITYDDFKKDIDNATKPTVGIYQNKSIYINAGDLPGDLKYKTSWGSLKNKIDAFEIITEDSNGEKFNAITPDIKQKTKEAYARIYGVPSSSIDTDVDDDKKGSVIGFVIQFKVKVTGNSRKVSNNADLISNVVNESASSSQQYTSAEGGARSGNPGDVRLTKFDGNTQEPIVGAEFKLTKYNSQTDSYEDLPESYDYAGLFKTDSDGVILFENLNFGNYRIVETTPAEGYSSTIEFKEGTGEFKIDDETSQELKITAYNYKKEMTGSGIITVNKYDRDNPNVPLEGAEFRLLSSNGAVYDTVQTDSQGQAVFNDVIPDTYTIEETIAPKGYDKESFVIMDGDDSVSGEAINITVDNTKQNYEYIAYNTVEKTPVNPDDPDPVINPDDPDPKGKDSNPVNNPDPSPNKNGDSIPTVKDNTNTVNKFRSYNSVGSRTSDPMDVLTPIFIILAILIILSIAVKLIRKRG